MPKIRSKSKKKNCNTRNSIFHRFSGTEKLHNPCVEELDSNNLLNNTKETIVPKVLESNRTSRSSCPQRVVSDIRLLRPSSRDTPRKVIGYFSHIHE